jgi:hypothetical protein
VAFGNKPRYIMIFRNIAGRPVRTQLGLRAMTTSDRYFESAAMMSSVIPSEKYSCPESSLRFLKDKTALDGRVLGRLQGQFDSKEPIR